MSEDVIAIPPIFTAEELVEQFGDQAYHRGVQIAMACFETERHEQFGKLSAANIELRKRGYHKYPRTAVANVR